MIEIVWRHDPEAPPQERRPETAADARARLDAGSAAFAALAEGGRHVVTLPAHALGLAPRSGEGVAQEPFAAVLGCSDARVPAELVLGQAANDLFVVRVAGNVPAAECLGSLDFAVEHLESLRLLAVLGHSRCGAVTAAVDAYLEPESYFGIARNPDLRAIVDAIVAAVTTADAALAEVHGPDVAGSEAHRAALVETAVVVNAALSASLLQGHAAFALGGDVGVAFGVYDLGRRSVGLPVAGSWRAGLADPPGDAAALTALAREAAATLMP